VAGVGRGWGIGGGDPPTTASAREAWQRIVLAPGVELHVRDDVAGPSRSLVERLLKAANQPEES
jgi:hypothetical protein